MITRQRPALVLYLFRNFSANVLTSTDEEPRSDTNHDDEASGIESPRPAHLGCDKWRKHWREKPAQIAAGIKNGAGKSGMFTADVEGRCPVRPIRTGGESQREA